MKNLKHVLQIVAIAQATEVNGATEIVQRAATAPMIEVDMEVIVVAMEIATTTLRLPQVEF